MLVSARRSRRCAVCLEPVKVGELGYWTAAAPASRPLRCMRCGEWPAELEGRFDAGLLAENQARARDLVQAIVARRAFERPARMRYGDPVRLVRARNLRVGDVVEHPQTHQLAQVGELHGFPDHVDVVTLTSCRWRLEPGELLEVRHRIVELEA